MITGKVTALREATIRLTLTGPNHQQHEVDAVIDTGFNGFVTLPPPIVRALRLPFVGNRRATLGDVPILTLQLVEPSIPGAKEGLADPFFTGLSRDNSDFPDGDRPTARSREAVQGFGNYLGLRPAAERRIVRREDGVGWTKTRAYHPVLDPKMSSRRTPWRY